MVRLLSTLFVGTTVIVSSLVRTSMGAPVDDASVIPTSSAMPPDPPILANTTETEGTGTPSPTATVSDTSIGSSSQVPTTFTVTPEPTTTASTSSVPASTTPKPEPTEPVIPCNEACMMGYHCRRGRCVRNKICGGFIGIPCPYGYLCLTPQETADAFGYCVKIPDFPPLDSCLCLDPPTCERQICVPPILPPPPKKVQTPNVVLERRQDPGMPYFWTPVDGYPPTMITETVPVPIPAITTTTPALIETTTTSTTTTVTASSTETTASSTTTDFAPTPSTTTNPHNLVKRSGDLDPLASEVLNSAVSQLANIIPTDCPIQEHLSDAIPVLATYVPE